MLIGGCTDYMAPEVNEYTENYSEKCDVFSVGAVFLEMNCGLQAKGNEVVNWHKSLMAQKKYLVPMWYTVLKGCLKTDPNDRLIALALLRSHKIT